MVLATHHFIQVNVTSACQTLVRYDSGSVTVRSIALLLRDAIVCAKDPIILLEEGFKSSRDDIHPLLSKKVSDLLLEMKFKTS